MAKHESSIPEISRDELVHLMHTATPILVNVLTHEQFERIRLPGSVNVPVNVIRDLAPLLFGKDDLLVVYCANFECTASPTAVRILQQLGFTNVYDFTGGIVDWLDGGLPVVSSEPPAQEQAEAA